MISKIRPGLGDLPQGKKMIVKARAGKGIERGERLVEQKNFRAGDESAGQCDALLLPAGQLARPSFCIAAEPDARERCKASPAPDKKEPGQWPGPFRSECRPAQNL
jgi:hypothetical protein